jgi:excisionase family DNA binding protein
MGQQKQRELTVEQAATTAECHPETIRRAIRRKELLARRQPTKRGRGYVISATDLASFIEKRRLS